MAANPGIIAICNMALSQVGVTLPISDFNQESAESKSCTTWYDQCRRALLTEAPWPFATKTATLAAIANYTPLRRGFAYSLPEDHLKSLDIWTGNMIDNPEARIRFEYELHPSGIRVLVTDADSVSLIYLADVQDPLQFPPLFVDALALGLGARLALALEKGDRQGLRQQYEIARTHAAAALLNEIPLEPDPDPKSIQAFGIRTWHWR